MTVGSIAQGGVSIPFLAIQTESGMIEDRSLAQAEELTTPGVNGRRWRTIFSQFPSFPMRTFSEATTYATGVNMKRQAESLTQKTVRLIAEIAATTYAYIDVHVSAVQATVHPGPIAGAGAGSGAAHVEIVWQLEMTDETQV
jgi:hypothetical protein